MLLLYKLNAVYHLATEIKYRHVVEARGFVAITLGTQDACEFLSELFLKYLGNSATQLTATGQVWQVSPPM